METAETLSQKSLPIIIEQAGMLRVNNIQSLPSIVP